MFNGKLPIALAAAATVAVLAACGGAKTTSSQARPQGGDGQTQDRPQTRQQARAARAQTEPPAAPAGPTVGDLRDMRVSLMGLNIPVGIAAAEASSENEAQAVALDSARADLIRWIAVQTHRFSETYAGSVGEAARKRWEERVALMSAGTARSAPAFKTAVEHDRANRTFKAHVLAVYDPVHYKQALGDAMAGNDEFNRRAQKDRLQKKMDAIIADFNSKYRR